MTAEAPVGTLHEMFFEPATLSDTAHLANPAENFGVLTPLTFTGVNGEPAAFELLGYDADQQMIADFGPLGCSTLTTAGMEMLSSLRLGVWTHQSTRACPQNQMPGFLQNQAVIISRPGLSQELFKSSRMSGTTPSGS